MKKISTHRILLTKKELLDKFGITHENPVVWLIESKEDGFDPKEPIDNEDLIEIEWTEISEE